MAPKPAVHTPVALAVLSLLAEREMHPYEMRRLMFERGHQYYIKIRGGILYHTVERLQAAGMIEPVESSREGRYPERTVYRLTERGRDEVQHWMRQLLSVPAEEHPWFPATLAFMPLLDRETVIESLKRRMIALEAQIGSEEGAIHGALESMGLQRIHVVESEYTVAMRRAELAWVRSLVEDLRTGALPWEFGVKKRDDGGGDDGSTVAMR
jgi:DNA-binding PadR family transcriptional regulator